MSYRSFFRSDTRFMDGYIRLTMIVPSDKKPYGKFKPDCTCEHLDLIKIKLHGRVVRAIVLKVPQKRPWSAEERNSVSYLGKSTSTYPS
jgi:hypothetical protein